MVCLFLIFSCESRSRRITAVMCIELAPSFISHPSLYAFVGAYAFNEEFFPPPRERERERESRIEGRREGRREITALRM